MFYNNKLFKYPFTEEEYNNIEKTWSFFEKFKKPFIHVTDYRNYIINEINKNYTPEEFYIYESILNKLFWNLRWLLYPLFIFKDITKEKYYDLVKNNYNNIDELPSNLLLCKQINYNNENKSDVKLEIKKINNKTFYRSFINKLIINDKENKIIYFKDMEGSSDIFSKNYFNLMTFSILFKRKLYDKIMNDPFIILNKNINLSKYYHQYDYPFPNLNFCTYSLGSKLDMMNRINKMYYDNSKTAKNWFKIIK
jgi:hypothetical protein